MLPRKNFRLKSSKMVRIASKTVNTDVNFLVYQLKYVFFSFEVRSQCFSLAVTFDQHNRLMRQKFSTCFLVKASCLWRPSFVVHVFVNRMCFFVHYDSGILEWSRMTEAVIIRFRVLNGARTVLGCLLCFFSRSVIHPRTAHLNHRDSLSLFVCYSRINSVCSHLRILCLDRYIPERFSYFILV